MINQVGDIMKLTNNLGDKPLRSQLYNRIKTAYYPMATILPFKLMEEFEVSRIAVKTGNEQIVPIRIYCQKRNICFKEKR